MSDTKIIIENIDQVRELVHYIVKLSILQQDYCFETVTEIDDNTMESLLQCINICLSQSKRIIDWGSEAQNKIKEIQKILHEK